MLEEKECKCKEECDGNCTCSGECSEDCSGDCEHCSHHSEESSCNGDCSNCSSCEGCGHHSKEELRIPLNSKSRIKTIIGVTSGKGGVGKSLVSSLIATMLRKRGYSVGILDADITGPSIPKSFGIKDRAWQEDGLILPAKTKTGIDIISANMLLENDDDPILWRGSLISSLVQQFYKDVFWGEKEVLLIDMPPGTGDVSLTTFQSIPIDGIVFVTTPQDLVSMIVKKSINMAATMEVPIVGLVENMSYVKCPNCDEKIYIYGHKDDNEIESQYGIPVLSRIPFDGEVTSLVDSGNVEGFDKEYIDELIDILSDMIEEKISN